MSTIFISYSRADEKWRALIAGHLSVLGAEFDVWDDQRIASGADWSREINEALQRASVAILLLSTDFLNSRFIAEFELPVIIEAARERGLLPYPVVVRPCLWRQSRVANLNIRHTYKDGSELSTLLPVEGAVERVLNKIGEEIAAQLGEAAPAAGSGVPSATAPANPAGSVRPSDPLAQIFDKGAAVIEVARGLAGSAAAAGQALGDDVKQLEAHIAALSEHGDRLASAKGVHDELHAIEFQCLGRLMVEARRLPDELAREQLDDYLKEFDGAVLRLRDSLAGAADPPWLATLGSDIKDLRAALIVSPPDPLMVLKAAAAVERDTSRQLTSVNGTMLRSLNRFDFTPLEEGVEALACSLEGTDPAMHEKLQEPLREFRRLRDELASLTEEHDGWQHLYDELRGHAPAHVPTDGWRQEIEIYWPDLEEQVGALCLVRKDKLVERLKKESAGFGQQLTAAGTTARTAGESFAVLRQMFAKSFDRVDADLKKTFENLVRRTRTFRA